MEQKEKEAVLTQAVNCCVYVNPPKNMQHMLCIIMTVGPIKLLISFYQSAVWHVDIFAIQTRYFNCNGVGQTVDKQLR